MWWRSSSLTTSPWWTPSKRSSFCRSCGPQLSFLFPVCLIMKRLKQKAFLIQGHCILDGLYKHYLGVWQVGKGSHIAYLLGKVRIPHKKRRYRRLLISYDFPQFIHDKTYDTGSALSLHFVVLGRDIEGISKLPWIKLISPYKISWFKGSSEIPILSLALGILYVTVHINRTLSKKTLKNPHSTVGINNSLQIMIFGFGCFCGSARSSRSHNVCLPAQVCLKHSIVIFLALRSLLCLSDFSP